jgi:hypothetical protein
VNTSRTPTATADDLDGRPRSFTRLCGASGAGHTGENRGPFGGRDKVSMQREISGEMTFFQLRLACRIGAMPEWTSSAFVEQLHFSSVKMCL